MTETIPTTDQVKSIFAGDGDWTHTGTAADRHEEFDRWLAEHNRGQQIKGIQGLLDFRPLPRDVRRYIEGYLEAAAEEAGRESAGVEPEAADDAEDDEEFCDRCFAGVDSSEHHEKCVVTGYAEDGESAPAPTQNGDPK